MPREEKATMQADPDSRRISSGTACFHAGQDALAGGSACSYNENRNISVLCKEQKNGGKYT
jgi:hypothetical protein